MRKLKFRMWDEKYNTWVNDPLFAYPNTEVLRQGFTIQQWTGLFDINGKEIYEGDIVNFGYTDSAKFTGEVQWLKDRASYGVICGGGFETFEELMDYRQYTKVVGNIFESESFDCAIEDVKEGRTVALDTALNDIPPQVLQLEEDLKRSRDVNMRLRRERSAQDKFIKKLTQDSCSLKILKSHINSNEVLPCIREHNDSVNCVLAIRADSEYDETNTYLPKWEVVNTVYYNKHPDKFDGWIELEDCHALKELNP